MRIVISGGGIAGLTLALKLLQNEINVTLLEKQAGPSAKTKGELLQPKSLAILKTLGVIEPILQNAQKIERTIVQELGLPPAAEQEAYMDYRILQHEFNYAVMIPHERLKQILLEACLRYRSDFYVANAKVISLNPAHETLKNQCSYEKEGLTETIEGDFFVGAEGKTSPIRKILKIPWRQKKYNHHFLTISFPRPPQLTEAMLIAKGAYFLGMFPLPNHRVRTVFMIKPDEYKQLLQLGIEELYRKFIEIYPPLDGFIQQVKSFKEIQLMIPESNHVTHYVRGNAVVIGDAAHSVHPMAGEGMNLAIQDADILGDLFVWMKEIGSMDKRWLRKYEQVRKPRVQYIASISNLSAIVYSLKFSIWRRFRMRIFRTIQENELLHLKQMLNISGLGIWRETWLDRLRQVGIWRNANKHPPIDQSPYIFTEADDYPWRK
jgi:2-polyprenyl-6-methoxyphenol hydroxylase-like FAD-dependent oxidoreductase